MNIGPLLNKYHRQSCVLTQRYPVRPSDPGILNELFQYPLSAGIRFYSPGPLQGCQNIRRQIIPARRAKCRDCLYNMLKGYRSHQGIVTS
jgi:hypothetical protein